MSVFLVAGETSSDAHNAFWIRELKKRHPQLEVAGMGGAQCKAAGMNVLWNAEDVSVMGFTEVLPKLKKIFRILSEIKAEIKKRRPRVVILSDMPDFNFRLLECIHQLKIPIVYFIAPQTWAWKPERIEVLKKFDVHLAVIFPFEEQYFRAHALKADFVGHALAWSSSIEKSKASIRQQMKWPVDHKIVALLPGSRLPQWKHHWPLLRMIALRDQLSKHLNTPCTYVVPVVPHLWDKARQEKECKNVIFYNVNTSEETQEIVRGSDASLICSGTATLEAALCETPSVLFYKTSWLTHMIYRMKVPYRGPIGMANILLEKSGASQRLMTELIQDQATVENLENELSALFRTHSFNSEPAQLLRQQLRSRRPDLEMTTLVESYIHSDGLHPIVQQARMDACTD